MAQTLPLQNGAYECVKALDAKLLGTKGTAGTGITAIQDYTAVRSLLIPLPNLSVATVDATTAGAHGSKLLFTFPESNITVLGATTNLTISRVGTNITATAAVVSSLGTTAVSNADATLTGTEADVVPSTAATLTAGAGVVKGESTSVLVKDGTTTPVTLYLNFAVPDAGSAGNDALLVNGSLLVRYITSGDN